MALPYSRPHPAHPLSNNISYRLQERAIDIPFQDNHANGRAPIKTSMEKKSNDFERIRSLSYKIMRLALQGLLRVDFLHEASKILMDFSGSDSVGMWLNERGKFYRCKVSRSAKEPFHFEIMPIKKDKTGRSIPQLRENTWQEWLSRDIFLGKFDPSLPCFTKTGSFWTGEIEKILPLIHTTENKLQKKNLTNDRRFHSFSFIPISAEKENIGLMQLKKRSKYFYQNQDVEFFEGAAHTVGVALLHRRAQVELRERVKEMTCLYGIAKLQEQEDVSLDDILQGIVEILPPAWLYPDIASARITLDAKIFATSLFCEGGEKQTAEIIINDQKRGMVEVVYSENKPELDEGPFLKEERRLIDTIAREIALIMERKQSEIEKEKLQDQLRHADRLATIGQLSAGVAHELNEPIGSIMGFAQLIKKNSDLPEQAQKDIEKIMKASLHAREVIKKLMLFARQMPPQKTSVNLNQIIEEGLYFLESRCAKEGIKVVRKLAEDLSEVTADPAQMTQVLVNIIVNAIQAMPEGGMLTIQTQNSGKFVKLCIEDTGAGIKEKELKQIFLPFFTTKDIGKGTGLGLAVVHGIVTSHGGSIHVDSKVNEGTRFTIRLPIAD
jgi:two-component system NtrC family sensor kinase